MELSFRYDDSERACSFPGTKRKLNYVKATVS